MLISSSYATSPIQTYKQSETKPQNVVDEAPTSQGDTVILSKPALDLAAKRVRKLELPGDAGTNSSSWPIE